MKEYVSVNGTCNTKLEGWEHRQNDINNTLSINYGDYGTKYLINYHCEPQSSTFYFVVRIDKDTDFAIDYDKNGSMSIKYGYYSHPFILKLDDDNNTNINLILKKTDF